MTAEHGLSRLFPLLLIVSVVTSGCIFSREIAHTRGIIEEEIPGSEFDRKLVFSVGSGTLQAAGWLTSLVPEEDLEDVWRYVDDIERVKVGIYETKALPESSSSGVPVLSSMLDRGWEVAVQARDDQDRIWFMYRSSRDRIRALYVIVLNEEHLIIARVEGHLDRIVQRAMEDYRPFSRLAARP